MGFKEEAQRKLRQLAGERDDDFDDLIFGKNPRRFLPPADWPDTEQFFIEAMGHYFNGEWIRCLTKKFTGKNQNFPTFDTTCPLCKRFNRERARVNKKFRRNSDEGKEAFRREAKDWAPRVQYYANVFNPEDAEPEIKVLRFGPQLLAALLTEYIDANITYFHPKNGRTMTIKKKSTGPDPTNVEYSVVRGEKRQDISEAWEQVKDHLPDLQEKAGPVLPAAQIEEYVAAAEVAYEDEERPVRGRRSSDGDDGGDDVETPREKKGAKKPPCFGDPDVHDPKTEICQDCSFFEACKTEDEVAQAYQEGRYRAKKKLRVAVADAE